MQSRILQHNIGGEFSRTWIRPRTVRREGPPMRVSSSLSITTALSALQELEDVLHHVAARGGWLDFATHPVPLHSRPEHQTRSLRAGRGYEREVGVCNGRFARCPCNRVSVRLEHPAHWPTAVAEALGDVREVSAATTGRELQPQQHRGGG